MVGLRKAPGREGDRAKQITDFMEIHLHFLFLFTCHVPQTGRQGAVSKRIMRWVGRGTESHPLVPPCVIRESLARAGVELEKKYLDGGVS